MNNTVQEIIKKAKGKLKTSNNQVRYGQALMNVLSKVSPFLYHQIIAQLALMSILHDE